MIKLEKIIPEPLRSQINDSSEIWNCDITFQENKKYFISAYSGKGKTTLQHFIYGIRDDFKGNLFIKYNNNIYNIKDIDSDLWAKIRSEYISVVFQDLKLFENLTAIENIEIKNELNNYKSKQEIEEMMRYLGVYELADNLISTLSYGQRQRIAIIRSLCQPFKFLILDEPFSHLDSQNYKLCCNLIREECDKQDASYIVISLEDKYLFDYDEILNV